MADSRQGGTLADTHEGKPGLPRGRSRRGEAETLPAMQDTLVSLHLAVMAGRRWERAGQA